MSVARRVSRTTARSPSPTWHRPSSASSPSAGETRTSWRRSSADEVVDDPVHGSVVMMMVPVGVRVAVPVGAAVELERAHRLLGVTVVLDDHAQRLLDELLV